MSMHIEIADIDAGDAVTIIVEEKKPRHGRFVTMLADGSVILPSSRQPLLDAARVLLALGCDPEQRLVMRHQGSSINAMSGKIGELAKLTVRETDTEGPHFRALPTVRRQCPFALARVGRPCVG